VTRAISFSLPVIVLALGAWPIDALAAGDVSSGGGSTAQEHGREPVVIWPALTPAGDALSTTSLHKPLPGEKAIAERAQELDATLRDAVQDLGFTLYVAESGPTEGHMRDQDLLERASRAGPGGASNTGTWVVSPRIETAGGDWIVRIVVVPPNGHELRVRVETVAPDSISVRGLVMLRDLLSPATAQAAEIEHERNRIETSTGFGVVGPLRSQGRAVLAINSALFGAFTAYSVQRASGSDDPRVLYPLLALGTGIGIGSALLVADEWDVTTGDAWFLSAGAWWGAAAGLFIADGRHIDPLSDRYAWGVGGGFAGLTLATVALVRHRMDEGDATIAHSGGALGMFGGAISELMYRGTTTEQTPFTGMGYGAVVGLVGAGVLTTRITTTPSRVLLVDVGAGLGALAGAAAASPLIFDNITEAKTRGWLAATLGGAVLGGGVAWYLTRGTDAQKLDAWRYGAPVVGVIGSSATPTGVMPAYGAGWSGAF
jgi:hypothetical protein